MELLAATLGARLKNSVFQAMDFSETKMFFSSDSWKLSWLRRSQQWSRFVWNRVEEIKRPTDISAWRHVPGAINPADLLSRGCTIAQLVQLRWWEGPSWLKRPQKQWPQEELLVDEEHVNLEICKSSKK